MIGQKPLLAIMSCNLIEHPYIGLERQSISGRTFSQNDLKNVRCQTVMIISGYDLYLYSICKYSVVSRNTHSVATAYVHIMPNWH